MRAECDLRTRRELVIITDTLSQGVFFYVRAIDRRLRARCLFVTLSTCAMNYTRPPCTAECDLTIHRGGIENVQVARFIARASEPDRQESQDGEKCLTVFKVKVLILADTKKKIPEHLPVKYKIYFTEIS